MKQLENWKQTMADSTLSADEIDELASHLVDRIDELVKMGLNEEQAWILAENELGKPAELKKEYGKLHPAFFSTKRILAILCIAAFIFTISSFVLADSGRCTNANPVFEKYDPASVIYKKELVSQVSKIGTDNLAFTFKDFKEEANQTRLLVGLSGKGLCAETWMVVKSWKNLEGIKRTKGMGYRGAGFLKPAITISGDAGSIDFSLESVAGIND